MAAEDYERYLDNSREALAALVLVVEDPELGTYEPHRSALREAVDWLEMEVTCGDCVEGRCHWGGRESQASKAAAGAGQDYRDTTGHVCGCDRHEISVEARRRRARMSGPTPASLTRRLAKSVIRMAQVAAHRDSYGRVAAAGWATDPDIALACETLGWTPERARTAEVFDE